LLLVRWYVRSLVRIWPPAAMAGVRRAGVGPAGSVAGKRVCARLAEVAPYERLSQAER